MSTIPTSVTEKQFDEHIVLPRNVGHDSPLRSGYKIKPMKGAIKVKDHGMWCQWSGN